MGGISAWSRLKRIIGGALVALAFLLLFLPAAASAARPERIIAVGDLHGDYEAWVTIARAAGIIDSAGHWAAGRTTLVQLGDVTDREPESLQIIRNLQQLQSEAPRSGGKVVVVLGNHEAMNLLGDNRYTTPGEFAAFADDRSPARREQYYMSIRKQLEAAARSANPNVQPSEVREQWISQHPLGWLEHRLAWGPSGELGRWATRNPAVVKIGDTLFAHGGLSVEYSKLSIEDINRRISRAMAAGDDSPSTILFDPLGPLWYRGLVTQDQDAAQARAKEGAAAPPPLTPDQELDAVLAAYGAKRLVVGHTPSPKGIQILGNGRLARIDTGISRAYGGSLTWLEINGGTMTPHIIGRTAQ